MQNDRETRPMREEIASPSERSQTEQNEFCTTSEETIQRMQRLIDKTLEQLKPTWRPQPPTRTNRTGW